MPATQLNLALVISELNVGGAEKNFTLLACQLVKEGHQVEVYSLDPPPQESQAALATRLQENSIPVHYLTQKSASRLPPIGPLRRQLARQNPDVIQSFLLRANLAAVLAGRKIAPVCLGIRQAEPRHWARQLEYLLMRRAQATVFVSRATAEHYPGRHAANGNVIPNAVEVPVADLPAATSQQRQRFWHSRLSLPTTDQTKVLLFVGRLVQQKNVQQLLQLMLKHLQRHPETHFVILGTGPQKQTLVEICSHHPAGERVHLVGWQADAGDWMRHADLLTLFSRWEGLPNVVLEAMAAGIPFLSLPTHGLDDIFSPGTPTQALPTHAGDDNDLRCPEQAQSYQVVAQTVSAANPSQPVLNPDARGFLEQLELLQQQPQLRSKLGQWNQAWVREHFSVEAMAAAYEQLFRKLSTD